VIRPEFNIPDLTAGRGCLTSFLLVLTGGTAHRLAAERADIAVVAALTPICVEKFLQNSDAKANLAALQKISSNWEQGEYLEKGGWTTQPGATSSDYHLARACAEKLIQAKTAAQ
jgi:hypothetical protein